MKKSDKKLSLGKIKVADLSKVNADATLFMQSLACVPSIKITCLSQGPKNCSADICIF
ncbi:hypothetical protein [Chitinophaga arvensicola]|uniref:Uncharacterized protein n=1 Tax=Chitinophaga arvensicola TaxID=29529 RepID=A0A1I0S840_9BACT|nr:hypothetical protein [Chitinophaga arvensicola]SEW52056.1 hypothetical protein SAMN04488122_4664 [Chitinophaga arvensicola]